MSLLSCEKEKQVFPVAIDPNTEIFSASGGILEIGTLSTLEKLYIPNGAFTEETVVGYNHTFGAGYTSVAESNYPVNNQYQSKGLFFYPFNTVLNNPCTLDWSISNVGNTFNLSNIHFYKIANVLIENNYTDEDDYIYPSSSDFTEILNYTTRNETVNGIDYKVYTLPVDSFEYYYVMCVEVI